MIPQPYVPLLAPASVRRRRPSGFRSPRAAPGTEWRRVSRSPPVSPSCPGITDPPPNDVQPQEQRRRRRRRVVITTKTNTNTNTATTTTTMDKGKDKDIKYSGTTTTRKQRRRSTTRRYYYITLPCSCPFLPFKGTHIFSLPHSCSFTELLSHFSREKTTVFRCF